MAKKKTMQERVEETLKKEQDLYQRAKIKRQLIVSFPYKRKVPLLGRVGVKLIAIAGGILDTQYYDAQSNV